MELAESFNITHSLLSLLKPFTTWDSVFRYSVHFNYILHLQFYYTAYRVHHIFAGLQSELCYLYSKVKFLKLLGVIMIKQQILLLFCRFWSWIWKFWFSVHHLQCEHTKLILKKKMNSNPVFQSKYGTTSFLVIRLLSYACDLSGFYLLSMTNYISTYTDPGDWDI